MTIDDIRQLSEIFTATVTPGCLLVVTVLQIVNFVRTGQMKTHVDKIEASTNSMMARQRVADHAAGVLEERERKG